MIGSFPVLRHSTYAHTPPWSGSVDTHDTTHTHTHSSLFHSNTYILSEKYSIHYIQKSTSSTRRQSIHAWRAFVDATSRARLETSERRRRGRTNERTRSSSSPIPTKRDATASHSRANHRCRENPLAERDGKVNARGIHSLIHSFIRFGDARDGTLKSRDDVESRRCRRSRSRRRGRRETMEASETTDARIGRRDARGRRGETGTRLGTRRWRLERPIPIDEVGRARAMPVRKVRPGRRRRARLPRRRLGRRRGSVARLLLLLLLD